MNSQTAQLLEQHFDTAFGAPDGIAKLRELILTLAMQGKLVEQDPNDPPASELLKEIEAEKQRLVKAGKIKKPKPLPAIKQEEVPYELPQVWEWVRLGEVVEILDSLRKPVTKQDREPGPYPYYGASGIVDYVSNYIFDEQLVLVGEDGAKWDKGDNTAFSISGKTWVNNHAHVLRPDRSVLNDGFLIYCLVGMDLQPYITGMTVPKLNQARLVSILVPLPPLPEQHRIVARIDQLMARCDALEKLLKAREEKRLAVHAAAVKQLLDAPDGSSWVFIQQHFSELYTVKENVAELRKAILQLAVMGRLVPQEPNDPPASELLKEIEKEKASREGAKTRRKDKQLPPIKPEEIPCELPEGWEWATLQDVGFFLGGKTPSKNRSVFWDGNVPWVSPKDMKSLEIQDSEDHVTVAGVESGLAIIPEKSILMVVRSGILRRMFPVAVNTVPCTINQDLKALVPYQVESSNYLLLMLRGFEQFILEKSTKQGVTVESVKFDEFANTKFPLPPLPEQHRIVACIDQLMALCDTLEQRIDAATGKRTELLGAVMGSV